MIYNFVEKKSMVRYIQADKPNSFFEIFVRILKLFFMKINGAEHEIYKNFSYF